MKRELIAYGTPFIDNLVHIDHLPTHKDEGARILQTSWQGGGKVSSALTAFGQLGGYSTMLGVAGADSYGEFLIRDYQRYNVDTSHMVRDGINYFSLVLSDKVSAAPGERRPRVAPPGAAHPRGGRHRLL